jgi:hypothetical protein
MSEEEEKPNQEVQIPGLLIAVEIVVPVVLVVGETEPAAPSAAPSAVPSMAPSSAPTSKPTTVRYRASSSYYYTLPFPYHRR